MLIDRLRCSSVAPVVNVEASQSIPSVHSLLPSSILHVEPKPEGNQTVCAENDNSEDPHCLLFLRKHVGQNVNKIVQAPEVPVLSVALHPWAAMVQG